MWKMISEHARLLDRSVKVNKEYYIMAPYAQYMDGGSNSNVGVQIVNSKIEIDS
jgi:hypothetical protein